MLTRLLPFAFRTSRLTFYLSLLTLLLVRPAFSQVTWERIYSRISQDYGYSVQQTKDGGYIVAGTTCWYGYRPDGYLIKTNAYGDTLWTRDYGGGYTDYGESVQQAADSSYVVAGLTSSYGSGVQVYLVKFNAAGGLLWEKNFGGAGDDYGFSVQQTQDGGCVVVGQTSSFGDSIQIYLVKTSITGDTLWTRAYGGVEIDVGRSVQQTQDGGFIIAGYTSSFGNSYQFYLIKTNPLGDTLWTRTFGGAGDDQGYSVQQTSEGGYIVVGYTSSFGNGYQFYLIKTNASGDTLWTRTFGGAGDDQGYSVQQSSDGGYIVSGVTFSFRDPVKGDVYLIKTNSSGDTLWTRSYGGAESDCSRSAQQTTDGGFIIAGYTNSLNLDVYLIKTDANGNVGVEDDSQARIKPLTSNLSFSVVPNPFTSFTSVPGHASERFALYDISGRKVGIYQGNRIGWDVSPGVYFLRPEGKDAKPLRIVKLK